VDQASKTQEYQMHNTQNVEKPTVEVEAVVDRLVGVVDQVLYA
jgi:hypothetical protein